MSTKSKLMEETRRRVVAETRATLAEATARELAAEPPPAAAPPPAPPPPPPAPAPPPPPDLRTEIARIASVADGHARAGTGHTREAKRSALIASVAKFENRRGLFKDDNRNR